MRIIAGALGGRIFADPKSNRTHPMSDKVRGGLFNALGDIDNLSVLDAFAGSGAVGFEALSRNANAVVAIEHDRRAAKSIRLSAAQLGLANEFKLIEASNTAWSDRNTLETFDIVISDPPFDTLPEPAVKKVAQHVVLHGMYVLHWPPNAELPQYKGLQEVARRKYGDSQLVFYRRVA